MADSNDKKPFWSIVCDNLKPILGLITALIMLYAAWAGLQSIGPTPPPPNHTEFDTNPLPSSPMDSLPPPVTVQGTVTDEDDVPVGGSNVSIGDLSDITGDDGIYIIQDVPVGVSIIRVERMDEVVYISACEIEGGNGIEVVDISIPAEESTAGEIRLFSAGTVAVGADTYIDGEYQGRMFQSGSGALFQITGIPPETYQIKVTKSGYQDFIGNVTVIAGQRTEIDCYLEPSSLTQLSISPDPPSFDLGSMSAGETASRIFSISKISNSGGGTLEWSISDDQPWITVNPTSGTDSGTVTLNINTAGLSPGSYIGNITLTSNSGTRTGTISLTVKSSSLLVSPLDGAVMDNGRTDRKDSIVWDFDWSDVKGATQYQLYVKKDTAKSPVIDTVTTSSSYHHIRAGSYITNSNLYGWTWKVRAQVNGQWGEWSETRNFVVEKVDTDLISNSPLLVSPLDGAVMDNGRTDRKDSIVWDFDWSDVKGATQYQLYVKKDTAKSPVIDTVTTSSSYHHISAGSYIANSNRYGWAWKVRAQVNGQWGEWSETRNFVVEEVNTD